MELLTVTARFSQGETLRERSNSKVKSQKSKEKKDQVPLNSFMENKNKSISRRAAQEILRPYYKFP